MDTVHLLGPPSLGDVENTLDGPEVGLVPAQAALMMAVAVVEEPCHSIAVVTEPGVVLSTKLESP
eukprot:12185559-Prorocentrum_lima.AAC.1